MTDQPAPDAALAVAREALRTIEQESQWVARRTDWEKHSMRVGRIPTAQDACAEIRRIAHAGLAATEAGGSEVLADRVRALSAALYDVINSSALLDDDWVKVPAGAMGRALHVLTAAESQGDGEAVHA